MLLSQASANRFEAYFKSNYTFPQNVPAFEYVSQIAQAEFIKLEIETQRISMPHIMGSMVYQMNDCMLGTSFSTVDYSGVWKPAQYTLREAFSHILVAPRLESQAIKVYAVSDALKNIDAILLARLIDFNGNVLFVKQIPVEIKANSSSVILEISQKDLLKKANPSACCFQVQLNLPTVLLSQNEMYFSEPKNLALTKPNIDININKSLNGYNLILRTNTLAKNVFISLKSGKGDFSDNNLDLFPGDRTKVHIVYSGSKEQLSADLQLFSLADTQ